MLYRYEICSKHEGVLTKIKVPEGKSHGSSGSEEVVDELKQDNIESGSKKPKKKGKRKNKHGKKKNSTTEF